MKSTKYFDDFNVIQEGDNYSFVHVKIAEENFYNILFNYFFSEDKMLGYIENKESVNFLPTKKNYVKLYKNLKKFIDSENLDFEEERFYEELKKYILIDNEDKESLLKFRKDKFGKIGEYIFSIILIKYFNMTSIIPKLTMVTDPNMSVFGIDALFYNKDDKFLLFGESKFYNDLDDGINALKKSLHSYEKQIEDEYLLVLSNTDNYNMPIIRENYISSIEECYTFKEFIQKEKIKNIGIPLFVLHGGKVDIDKILNSLNKIDKKVFFDLNTIYYCISLPIINKETFKIKFLEFIYERVKKYEEYK